MVVKEVGWGRNGDAIELRPLGSRPLGSLLFALGGHFHRFIGPSQCSLSDPIPAAAIIV